MISSRSQLVTITPPAGVTLTGGGAIRFTRDGSSPNASSEEYTEPFVVDRTTTVKAIIVGGQPEQSDVESFPIVIRVSTPTISPAGGSFDDPVIIEMECATANAEIRYTLNGPIPDESSTLYTGAFLLAETGTIQARAFLSPKDPSASVTSAIVIASTSAVYFGYSPLRMLNEAQVKAMSNSPQPTNMVAKQDFFGTYRIGGSATVSDYFYFWCPATFSHPRIVDGFRDPVALAPGAIAMAGAAFGFTDGPNNGWFHKNLTVDGVAGRLYGTYFQLGDGSTPVDVIIQ